MKLIIAVGVGSFIGGILRYLISIFIQNKITFPYATFVVNIIGCFLIGMVFAAYAKNIVTDDWRLFLATGVLGGFTTFSAFSYESFSMMRSGLFVNAVLYISLSIIIGLLATFMGYSLLKNM
ncbi:MAG: fluoride efflux transporter CrcB [Ginsengibacter sp.]